MEITNKKECPKCKSTNVFDTSRRYPVGAQDMPPSNKEIPEPTAPVFKCRNCKDKEEFICFAKSIKI